jgi:hypothetical protein
MSVCHSFCSGSESGQDIVVVRRKIRNLLACAPRQIRRRWFTLEKGYYIMGLQHALNVVDSIMIRFVEGYSSQDEVFIRNILETNDEDKD